MSDPNAAGEQLRQHPIRTAAAGMIGNVLEWFDFAVYGYLSAEIGQAFFPTATPTGQRLLAFATFAIGFIARPIGSIVLGMVGDRIGRRALLTLSIALMGGSTLMIGLLPTYQSIGFVAPALLALMRIIQGISLGGEFTGSMVYTTELSSPLMRGLVSSSTAVGTSLGFLLGSLTVYGIHHGFGAANAMAWGWRIPFIASVTFCLIGYFLRHGIHETQHGEQARASEKPQVIKSLVQDWKPILLTFGIVGLTNVAYYFIFAYATETRKAGGHDIFQLVNTLSLLCIMMAKPAGGFLSDRMGRLKLMRVLNVAMMLITTPAVWLMLNGSPALFFVGQVILAIPCGMALGLQGAMLVEIYPLRTRVMSMSVGYSISLAITGGIGPFLSSALIDLGVPQMALAGYVIIYGVVGLVLMSRMHETNHNSLHT
ncbi:MAG TPA: MFS transporter [Kofleriaceae bacterium]|jgi:MHS family proline/betaine transporter-like MFS transporter